MAFLYGGWSNSIRIEIPGVLPSASSSSNSSLSSNSSDINQLFSKLPLDNCRGELVDIPGLV